MTYMAYTQSLDDEFENAFPGCLLTHQITVMSEPGLVIAVETLKAVDISGGTLDQLVVGRIGMGLTHRLTVAGLRPQQARRLSDQIAALPGVIDARVEHRLVRP